MNTKYFGEFLVKNGVIRSHDLIEALIEQIKTQPPICQIAFEGKHLSADSLLSIFRIQQDQGVDFLTACKAAGFYSEELKSRLEEDMIKLRRPLGELLVSKGVLDLKSLSKMLDEFLSQCQAPATTTYVSKAPIESAPIAPPEPEEETLQIGIVLELEEVFDERKRKVIKAAMSLMKDKASIDRPTVTKLFRDCLKIVHTINGLLRLFGINRLGALMTGIENVIENHLQKAQDSGDHQYIADLVYRSFECAWNLRNGIAESNSESTFLNDSGNRKEYEKLLEELNEFSKS